MMMKAKQAAKLRWTEADRDRHRAIRDEFEHCPTQEELEASGAYDGPIKSGAYFQVRVLLDELKKARQTAGLTLDLVSERTGMDQATRPGAGRRAGELQHFLARPFGLVQPGVAASFQVLRIR
jgi:hypothetical protein